MSAKLNPYVILIKDNLIIETFKCKNGQEVEKKFLKACKEMISNFDTYNQDDISVILEDGFERYGDGSISIVWL
ncbi:MAG: hypothetical protein AABY22_25200 [Nanoarchaeota archaeon]